MGRAWRNCAKDRRSAIATIRNAASPYAEQEEDDPDDDSIREDLIDRIGDKVSGPENRSIGCRDPMFAAYLDHLADDDNDERMAAVASTLAAELDIEVPDDPQKADVIRMLLRLDSASATARSTSGSSTPAASRRSARCRIGWNAVRISVGWES